MDHRTANDVAPRNGHPGADSAAPPQASFIAACAAATARIFAHRKALRRVEVRIGFWPEGLVISAKIPARNNDEFGASAGSPRIIPWGDLATVTDAQLVDIVDELCEPLYAALGVVRPS